MMIKSVLGGTVLGCLLCLLCLSASAQMINELDINPNGTDQPCEYVELRGTPGAIIENVHFVAFEGDSESPMGNADFVVSFGSPGPAFGPNGLIVITGTAPCGSRTYPAGATRLQTTLLDSTNGLENGTISFLLISSATAITPSTDYDANNDGTLEGLPVGAVVLDAVAWSDGGGSDRTYGGVTLSASGGDIGAATRFANNTTANSASAWYAGAMTGTNDATTYSPTVRTSNFPSDGALTPGAPNVGTIDTGLSTTFTAYLSGSQEVPANASPAKGFGRVTLNEAETSITVSVTYGSSSVPLSSNVISGHIHGPAAPGVNAGVLFDLMPAGGAPFGSVANATFAVTPAQVANLKAGLLYINIHTVNNMGGEIRGQIQVPRSVMDSNGDGRTDYVVTRPAGGPGSQLTWHTQFNGGSPFSRREWGISGDQTIAGDYDGDGLDDIAVFRPSNATFYIVNTATLTMRIEQFGETGDNAGVVGDYDGDGRDDLALYRPGSPSMWFYKTSPSALFNSVTWGEGGDAPAPGDYDGDGRADFVVWRPITFAPTEFWIRLATGAQSTVIFGTGADGIAPGDYDGDGKTDLCVLRPAGGLQGWEFEPSGTPGITVVSDTWGIPGDLAVPGDYDGDGKSDYAVWRPGNPGTFFVMTVGDRRIFTKQWGQIGDTPVAHFVVE